MIVIDEDLKNICHRPKPRNGAVRSCGDVKISCCCLDPSPHSTCHPHSPEGSQEHNQPNGKMQDKDLRVATSSSWDVVHPRPLECSYASRDAKMQGSVAWINIPRLVIRWRHTTEKTRQDRASSTTS